MEQFFAFKAPLKLADWAFEVSLTSRIESVATFLRVRAVHDVGLFSELLIAFRCEELVDVGVDNIYTTAFLGTFNLQYFQLERALGVVLKTL